LGETELVSATLVETELAVDGITEPDLSSTEETEPGPTVDGETVDLSVPSWSAASGCCCLVPCEGAVVVARRPTVVGFFFLPFFDLFSFDFALELPGLPRGLNTCE
jgi:hypothetical protein